MNNTFIFFRHAPTKIDPSKPANKWILSEEGFKEIKESLQSSEFDDVDVIISSAEKKAIQTAYFLAER